MTTTSDADSSSAVVSSVMPKVPVTMDTKGRVRTSKEQRQVILAEFERSGLSAAHFAQRTGLKYSTLAGWVQRYRRTRRQDGSHPVRLLEAVVAPTAPTSGLLVHLPGGAQIEIRETSQVSLVVALIRALEKPC